MKRQTYAKQNIEERYYISMYIIANIGNKITVHIISESYIYNCLIKKCTYISPRDYIEKKYQLQARQKEKQGKYTYLSIYNCESFKEDTSTQTEVTSEKEKSREIFQSRLRGKPQDQDFS